MPRVSATTAKKEKKPLAPAAKKEAKAAPVARKFKQTKAEKEAQKNYTATVQRDGKPWGLFRGNTPKGMSLEKYVKAYNAADTMVCTSINKLCGRKDKLNSDGIRLEARKSGITRAIAVHQMKKDGRLPQDFVDNAEH